MEPKIEMEGAQQGGTNNVDLLHRSRTQFLTGIRAYAALGVVIVHCTGDFKGSYDLLDNFLNFGRFGVVAFFVLSSFSLAISMAKNPPKGKWNLLHYFSRRFWRIVPLYFLVCFMVWMLPSLTAGSARFDVAELLMHLSFLNVFNHQYANSLIGVEWAIPLEMVAYLFLPMLFFVTKNYKWRWGIPLTLVLYALGKQASLFEGMFPEGQTFYDHDFSLVKYFFAFYAGTFAFNRISSDRFKSKDETHDVWVFTLVLFLPLYAVFFPTSENLVVTAWVIAVIYALLGAGKRARWIFENRWVLLFGKISFSVYLLHMPLFKLIMPFLSEHTGRLTGFALFLCLLMGISVLSYHFIEQRFIRLGECWFAQCKSRNMAFDEHESRVN